MIRTDEAQTTINDLIEAFEAAHAERDEVDLTEFLPATDHPLYLEVRRELLRVDLELSWLDGRRHRFADYARQFPDLFDDRATVQDVAFEEYRLRTLAGEAPSPREYEELYGVSSIGWAKGKAQPDESNIKTEQGADVALLLNIAHTIGHGDSWRGSRHGDAARALLRQNAHQSNSEAAFLLAQAMTALPEVGSTFLDFRLIAELGRGSFGRVYLARQGDLANRLVALKITVDLLGEEQKLAQLQHTNVVPIYSVHQAGPFQAVCMPYFGSATLADVISAMQKQAALPMSGAQFVRTICDRKARFAEASAEPDRPAALTILEESSHVDAVLSIAECVSEGLIHAHERGILHRDLKPANILLTDEGRPMLVDFNLSADVKLHTGLTELQMGGTLPYMAPEHLEAMRGASRTTDARSDLYALGVVLFELLTGRLPYETRTGHVSEVLPPMIAERMQAPPSVRRWNPAVSPAVESMVRHCLQPDPGKRYQSAAELQEDVRRQRHHRPLRHAPEPSIRERAQKWVRRHPRLTSPGSLGGIAIFLVLCYLAPIAWQAWEQWQQAIDLATKADNEVNVAKRKTNDAEGTAKATQAQIDALTKYLEFEKMSPSSRPIMEIVTIMQMLPEARPYEEKHLAEAMAECRRSLQFYRVLEDADWRHRPAVRELPPPERDKLCRKNAELLYALTHAELASLTPLHDQTQPFTFAIAALTVPGFGCEVWGPWKAIIEARIMSATAWNSQACACFEGQTVPWYLTYQKAELTHRRGDRKEAQRLFALAEELPWFGEVDERYWAASALIGENQLDDALALLSTATDQSPKHKNAWLLMAWCHHNLHHSYLAQTCYDKYLTLEPDGVWGYYNRGLLSLKEKNWSSANKDFGKVLEKHRDLAWAYAHRASARRGQRMFHEAIADLQSAIQFAPEVPEFYFVRAQIHSVLGNRELEENDRRRFLLHEPQDSIGWLYRGVAKYESDPHGALADFDKALALNPSSPLTLFKKACLLADVLGRVNESIEVLNKVLDQNPDFANARYQRGIILAKKKGYRREAVADAEQLIEHEPTPARYYQAATIYALASRKDRQDETRAIRLLGYALRHGYGVTKYETDPNLQPLARLEAFTRLAEGLSILGSGTPPRMLP